MKRLCITFMILQTILIIQAKYSDTFPIGVFSYIHDSAISDHVEAQAEEMQYLGFNSNVIVVDNRPCDLTGLFSNFNSYGLDSVIIDKTWSNDPSTMYATEGLSRSNYYMFEAEFEDSDPVAPVDNLKSVYWYGSRNELIGDNWLSRFGTASELDGASYGNVWRCVGTPQTEGQPHMAYTDLRWRWVDTNNNSLRVEHEFLLNKDDVLSNSENKYLYIRFSLRFTGIPLTPDHPDNTPLLSFTPCSIGSDPADPIGIMHSYETQYNEVTVVTLGDYLGRIGGRVPFPDFFDFELKIKYSDLLTNGLLISFDDDTYQLKNINPRCIWHGHYTLELDYIEFEDEI